ncbi:MAG TPA: hypothetical protein PK990_09480, partial [Salinivirgaceae bacterium]|nr:hypothetical protein [Salinivirgaceae bacterium]
TLLNNIVQSIAHIPSEISRSIYIQQCSRMFEISEDIFYSAVAKELREKIGEHKKGITTQTKITPKESIIKKTTVDFADNSVEASERDLIRFMLEYGDRAVFISRDEEDPEQISIVTVAEFIVEELESDELIPIDSVWAKIFNIFSNDLKKNIQLNQLYFVNHPDIEVSSRVADLMAKKYPLSRFWEEYGISYNSEEQLLARNVQNLVNEYKWRRILELQKVLTSRLANSELSDDEIRAIMTQLHKINILRNDLMKKMGSRPSL